MGLSARQCVRLSIPVHSWESLVTSFFGRMASRQRDNLGLIQFAYDFLDQRADQLDAFRAARRPSRLGQLIEPALCPFEICDVVTDCPEVLVARSQTINFRCACRKPPLDCLGALPGTI